MSAQTPHCYEFGDFRLDTKEKILFRDNQPIALRPKVFETLQVFVEHAGNLLGKDELIQTIWKDQFVEESNLTFTIKMLRRALNDDVHRPQFIETVPRRGYRFIAEVKPRFDTIPVKTEIAQTKPSANRFTRSPYLWLVAIAILLVITVVVVVQFARGNRGPSSSAPILSAAFKSAKLINPGSDVRAAITPDGKYVAYTNETGGKESIWLRQLETSENIQIVPPTDEQYLGLVISHDGNSLYFVRKTRTEPPTAAIYRVMTFGGIPVKIAEKTEGTVSVSPDDRQLSFMRCNYRDDDFCSLLTVDANGQNERRLLTRRRPIRLAGAQFSPDGRSIAFASGQSMNGGSEFELMLLDLATGAESLISPKTFFNITSLKWLVGGEGLLFTAIEILDGPRRIWQVSRISGEVKALTSDATNYEDISLDKTGAKLVATNVSNTFHLYIAPREDLNKTISLAAARTFSFGANGKILYAGDDGDIWMMNYDGGEQRQLTNSPYKDTTPCISSDGRYIFFASARSGSMQIWRMNADGSNQLQITHREGGRPIFITPDQHWVYFLSWLHGNLWKVSTEGAEESQVSGERIWRAAMSPDGKLLAYVFRAQDATDQFKLAVMSLESLKVSQSFPSTSPDSTISPIVWEPDSQSFDYFVHDTQN